VTFHHTGSYYGTSLFSFFDTAFHIIGLGTVTEISYYSLLRGINYINACKQLFVIDSLDLTQ